MANGDEQAFLDRLLRQLAVTPAPGRLWVGLSMLVGAAVLHMLAPAVFVSSAPLDLFVPLDAGYRVYSGQTPHVDFHTPIGPLHTYTYGLLMLLLGPDARVVPIGAALWSLVVAGAALWGARDRLPPALQVGFALVMGLIVLTPRDLDGPQLGHIASYNRIGATLAAVVLLASLLPPRRQRPRLDALVAASLLVALFFVKVTYFALAGIGLVAATVLIPASRRWALAAGLAALTLVTASLLLSPVAAGYLADLQATALAYDPAFNDATSDRAPGLAKLIADLRHNAALLSVPFLAIWTLNRAFPDEPPRILRVLALLLGGAGAVLAVNVQTHDHHAPALIAVALAAIGWLLKERQAGAALALTGLTAFVVIPRAGADLFAVAQHRIGAASAETLPATSDSSSPAHRIRFPGPARAPMHGPRLALVTEGAVPPEVFTQLVGTPTGNELRALLDEAARLAREHGGRRVFTTTFSQPLPFLLGAPPPPQGLGWYHAGRTFGGGSPLRPELLLAEVDLVLVPRVLSDRNNQLVAEALEPWVAEHWGPGIDTPFWRLYVRPDDP